MPPSKLKTNYFNGDTYTRPVGMQDFVVVSRRGLVLGGSRVCCSPSRYGAHDSDRAERYVRKVRAALSNACDVHQEMSLFRAGYAVRVKHWQHRNDERRWSSGQ